MPGYSNRNVFHIYSIPILFYISDEGASFQHPTAQTYSIIIYDNFFFHIEQGEISMIIL